MSDQVAIVIALIGLVGLALAAMAGLGGAILGSRIAANATTRAAATAQATAGSDREEARRTRFADRKLALAVDLLLAADLHHLEADQQVASKLERWEVELDFGLTPDEPLPSVGPTAGVRAAYLALDLVAPAAAVAAGELYEATVPLGRLAAGWMDPLSDQESRRKWAREWSEATARWDDARRNFVDAVRRDLDVNIEPTVAV